MGELSALQITADVWNSRIGTHTCIVYTCFFVYLDICTFDIVGLDVCGFQENYICIVSQVSIYYVPMFFFSKVTLHQMISNRDLKAHGEV